MYAKKLIALACTVWAACALHNYKPSDDSDCELAQGVVDYMLVNSGTSSEGLYIKILESIEQDNDDRLTFIVSQNHDGRHSLYISLEGSAQFEAYLGDFPFGCNEADASKSRDLLDAFARRLF